MMISFLVGRGFDFECLSGQDGLRDLSPGLGDDPPEGGAGYPHLLRRLFVVKPFCIRQPQCLDFIQGQGDLLQSEQGDPARFEVEGVRLAGHTPAFLGSRHETIISICSLFVKREFAPGDRADGSDHNLTFRVA